MTNFSQTAMLVSLNVRAYGARREDKKISEDVARSHNTTADAGNYTKHLVPKSALEPITKACTAMRAFHYTNTLPWLDDGIRILPSANYHAYKTEMLTLQDTYDAAVRDFVGNWSAIIEDARVRLNGMFRESDYPRDVSSRFGCQLRFLPVPDAGDFRVQIGDTERDMLRDQIAGAMQEASEAAMRDLWARVATAVKAMAERLAAFKRDAQGKVEHPFRDSLVENLRDLCGLIPRLNFAGDAALEQLRQEIEKNLLAESAGALRESDATRANVASKAEAIAARLSEFMV